MDYLRLLLRAALVAFALLIVQQYVAQLRYAVIGMNGRDQLAIVFDNLTGNLYGLPLPQAAPQDKMEREPNPFGSAPKQGA